MKRILFFGIIFFLCFFLVFFVKAARVALTPLVFEISGERGKTVEGEVRVMNPSYDEEISVKMESEDIFPEGEEGRVRLEVPPPERIPFSLSSWISFEPQSFVLKPREEKPVKFLIKVPENAEPGGHYAAVIAKVETPLAGGGTAVGIVPRVASLVLLEVLGPSKEEIKVVSFDVEKKYYEKGPIKFILRLENSGTLHAKPSAKVEIKNIFGKKVGEVSFETRTILPGSLRKLETEFPKKWLLGIKYTAVLTGFFGKNKIPLEEKVVSFWAFPWKLLVVLIFILIFFVLTRKRWKRAILILLKGEKALKE